MWPCMPPLQASSAECRSLCCKMACRLALSVQECINTTAQLPPCVLRGATQELARPGRCWTGATQSACGAQAGEILIKEGDTGLYDSELYVVKAGEFEVLERRQGAHRRAVPTAATVRHGRLRACRAAHGAHL